MFCKVKNTSDLVLSPVYMSIYFFVVFTVKLLLSSHFSALTLFGWSSGRVHDE